MDRRAPAPELPLVSIIIPCFNQARFIPQALESISKQDYASIETIVVDDGSSDGLAETVRPWLDQPGVQYIAQENRGLPQARNRGIHGARGELLKFLDADDWLYPTLIRKQVQVLSAAALGFVYCDFVRVDEHGNSKDNYSVATARQTLDGDILPSLLVGGYFPPLTVMLPRRVLDEVGYFDESLGGHADYELWMRIVASGYPVRFLNEKLAYYRVHAHNMSHDLEHMQVTRLMALDKIVAHFPQRTARALWLLGLELQDLLTELDRRARAQDEWSRELLNIIAAREQERARVLNFPPVRLARRWLKRRSA